MNGKWFRCLSTNIYVYTSFERFRIYPLGNYFIILQIVNYVNCTLLNIFPLLIHTFFAPFSFDTHKSLLLTTRILYFTMKHNNLVCFECKATCRIIRFTAFLVVVVVVVVILRTGYSMLSSRQHFWVSFISNCWSPPFQLNWNNC